jgi:hypothetical protein
MEKPPDSKAKPSHPKPGGEGWDPWDYYDCRSEADTPKPIQEYIDNTMPWLKDATAKRQAELNAASTDATTTEGTTKKAAIDRQD